VSAIAIGAIVAKYPVGAIVDAVRDGNARAVFPIALAFAIVQILLVSAWDTIVFENVLGGPRYVDVVRAKAGCAVLQAVGYVVNQGAYGTWIARATGTGVRVAVALILFTAGSDLAAGALFASAALAFAPIGVPAILRWGAPVLAIVIASLLIVPRRRELDLASPRPLHVFRAVPRRWTLLQLVARASNIALLIGAVYLATRAFGLQIPFAIVAAYMPIVGLVGSLPVNVLGFGAVQAAWLVFTPWADGPAILGFQVVWNLAVLVANLVRGAAFVPGVLRSIARGRPSALSSPPAV
jgi:hypothetical protein